MSSIVDYLRQVPLPEQGNMLSLDWWMEYMLKTYREDPYHVLVELACLGVIIWLLLRPRYDPKREERLSKKEEEDLINEWKPEPLVKAKPATVRRQLVVEGAVGPYAKVDGKKYMNFASHDFLGLGNVPKIKEACKATINKYGVGSCGPRGFYGTIDVHLKLEEDIAKFYNNEKNGAILYSDGIACLSSIIPAFCKRDDLIICDEAANFGIQQGILLSRSNVLYFKHNDVEDLERILQDIREKDMVKGRGSKDLNRRFIVVEGVYQYCGDMAPLRKIVDLKNKYKYRLMLDESFAIGVLGRSGRGSADHWGVPTSEIECIAGTLDTTTCSVGGFCTGLKTVVDHQRLSGAGYVFSASSPPYTCTATSMALDMIVEEAKTRSQGCRDNATLLRKGLRDIEGITFTGDDFLPLVHLRLEKSFGTQQADQAFFRIVEEKLYSQGLLVHVPMYIDAERKPPPPSLKISVSSLHSKEDINKAVKLVKEAFDWAFSL